MKKIPQRNPLNSVITDIHESPQSNTNKSQKTFPDNEAHFHKQRVFVWLKLKEITNVQNIKEGFYLELTHSRIDVRNISKEDENTLENLLKKGERYAYVLIIEQDNMEAANYFAEEQICILLKSKTAKQEVKSLREYGSEINEDNDNDNENEYETAAETETEATVVEDAYMAKGFIDILQLFSAECVFIEIDILLYSPKHASGINAVKTMWNIYTQTPLMKEVRITNFAFISFESIYNLNEDLLEMAENIRVDMIFQSRTPNETDIFDEYRICTFSVFHKNIIKNQGIHYYWEKLRYKPRRSSPDVRTGCTTRAHNFFKNLFCTEGRNFKFNEINILNEYTLTSNSTERFILTDEWIKILEEVLAFKEQRLIVKVYNVEEPEKILLQGVVGIQIFLYPNVNACRFAIALDEPATEENADEGTSTTFATLNISFLSPITECHRGLSVITTKFDKITPDDEGKYAGNALRKSEDRRSLLQRREDAYRKFDQEIKSIAYNIYKNNITDYNQSKSFVCCELKILSWKITDLIAFDFNVRVPTKSSIEFTNLITIVYKELIQRVYDILQVLDNKVETIEHNKSNEETNIQRKMSYIKLLNESGNTKLAKYLMEKFSRDYAYNAAWNFFKFLYDIEVLDFDSALEYARRPASDIYHLGYYYAEIAEIYISYMKLRENEKYFNEALIYLLEKLNEFSAKYPLQLEPWVLLYCIYSVCGYAPGMEFTRLKYENLNSEHFHEFPKIPYSRFSIYNDVFVEFNSTKGKLFYTIVKNFVWLGIYKLAEMIFDVISNECSDSEKYMFNSTIQILTNDLKENFRIKSFDEVAATKILVTYVNGNIEYHRGNMSAALLQYQRIFSDKTNKNQCLKLGLLRYAQCLYNEHKYLEAIKAYEKYLFYGSGAFVAYYGLGKAMYRLNRLKESKVHFVSATKYPIHVPEIWAYLALIDLKLGKSKNALKLWQYANLHQHDSFPEELLEELQTLDPNMFNLLI